MSNQDREIRLTDIPSELRNLRDEAERWRARWAQDGTEYRQQVRELTEALDRAVKARDAARQTCDDLTTHCEGQGNRIASLERSVKCLDDVVADWRGRSQEANVRAGRLWRWIEATAKEEGWSRDDLSDLISEAGFECDDCNGTGVVYTPGYHGDLDAADYSETCETCNGLGKVTQ